MIYNGTPVINHRYELFPSVCYAFVPAKTAQITNSDAGTGYALASGHP
jgi:hypothetical protein